MELLNLSNPHFVRCVKPNTAKSARTFDDKYVTAQVSLCSIPHRDLMNPQFGFQISANMKHFAASIHMF